MSLEERIDRIEQVIEKQNSGIQDLIRVSRIFLEQQERVAAQITGLRDAHSDLREIQKRDHEEWAAGMKELREAQADTDERLNILIATVDRIIRSWGNGGKSEE